MTSKNSFSSLLREDIKAKMWLVLMNTVIMFFNFTMVMAIQVQRVVECMKGSTYSYKEAIHVLSYYIGGENRATMFVTLLMACAAALVSLDICIRRNRLISITVFQYVDRSVFWYVF